MLTIFCQVTKIDGVTKWLASAGLVGTNVAGQVGTCCVVGFLHIQFRLSFVTSLAMSL